MSPPHPPPEALAVKTEVLVVGIAECAEPAADATQWEPAATTRTVAAAATRTVAMAVSSPALFPGGYSDLQTVGFPKAVAASLTNPPVVAAPCPRVELR